MKEVHNFSTLANEDLVTKRLIGAQTDNIFLQYMMEVDKEINVLSNNSDNEKKLEEMDFLILEEQLNKLIGKCSDNSNKYSQSLQFLKKYEQTI
jgi:hypothetical protein